MKHAALLPNMNLEAAKNAGVGRPTAASTARCAAHPKPSPSTAALLPTRGWGADHAADEEIVLTEEVETLVGLPSSRHLATAPRWLPGASPPLQASMKPIQYQ